MKTLLQTVVRRSRIALLGAGMVGAMAASAPTGAAAQVYNPEDGEQLLEEVVITVEGGERINDTQEEGSDALIGTIGVQSCQDLEDSGGSVTFNFNLNTENFQGEIELEDGDEAYLMEFGVDEGPGTCDREAVDGCRRLDEELNNITITENQDSVTVDMSFDRLRRYFDKQIEPCAFPGADATSLQTVGQGLHNDAGMHADTGTQDTGITDTSFQDTGGQDTGGAAAPVTGADRVYVVRLFLEGRQQNVTTGGIETVPVLADGALVLDRTRPPGVTNLRAAASENLLRMQFDPPEDTEDVENYHAFFASEPLQGRTPEELATDENVTRRLIKGVSEGDDGTRSGRVEELNQTAGEQLYVAVASRDAAENFSLLARTDSALTVKESTDFWEKYKSAGGQESGGCGCRSTSAPPAGGALVAALGLLVLGWRRRAR